jgi:hypothetical protein
MPSVRFVLGRGRRLIAPVSYPRVDPVKGEERWPGRVGVDYALFHNRGAWKDKRHTKAPWTARNAGLHEHLEFQDYQASKVQVRFSRFHWKPIKLDDGIAPEIDARRRLAVFLHVESEYRAPYEKVLVLRDAGSPESALGLK